MELETEVPNNFLPKYYNRINVMNDTNGSKGICKYINDEIYSSKACFNKEHPQGAYYAQGKYYFDFPSIWYNANSVNKAIGLRSINIYPKTFTLQYTFNFNFTPISGALQSFSTDLIFIADPKMSTQEIISGMALQMNTFIESQNKKNDYKIIYNYDSDFNVTFILVCNSKIKPISFSLNISKTNKDFKNFFGNGNKLNNTYTFKNVWNRKDLFIHASFVNYTSFNYLGKDGEFYPKISKIYDFAMAPQKFYFEISFDCMHPVEFTQVDFLIGLCLIVDEKKYNGE